MTAVISTVTTTTTRAGVLPAVATFFSGLALVFVVGFAPVMAVHNAAHDTRHTAAFPCH
ncbi:MAG TPA: CbtB-domain containing protein [Pseudomonadales bacterium]|nr:CbtB-domain containing protein [Pseudomonadales bacterium]